MNKTDAVEDGKKLAAAATDIDDIAIEDIAISPTQPRKTFEPERMKELTDSVRARGIIEPLLVRTVETRVIDGGKDTVCRYELVFGERRLRAAKEVGLKTVPCLVRAMTTEEAMELQLVEFLHRADLHPMEEARAYARLKGVDRVAQMPLEELARKVAKPVPYVLRRLKLCDLVPEAEKHFVEGRLSIDTALWVARVPKALQAKCADEVSGVKDAWDKTPMSLRQAKDHVERNYMLRLADASFSKSDAHLVSAAGPCSTCPKCTGNSPDLFNDVGSKAMCTDPACFKEKTKQGLIALKLRMEGAGRVVLPVNDSKKLFSYGSLKYGSGYVDLNEKCYDDPKHRTYRQLVGKEAKTAAVVAIAPNGKAHDVMTKDRMAEALKKAGVKVKQQHQERHQTPEEIEKEKREREEEKEIAREINKRAQAVVAEAAPTVKRVELLRWLAGNVIEVLGYYNEELEFACERRFPDLDHRQRMDRLQDSVGKMSEDEALGLLAELFASDDDAKMFKVDLKAIKKQVREERKAATEKSKALEVA